MQISLIFAFERLNSLDVQVKLSPKQKCCSRATRMRLDSPQKTRSYCELSIIPFYYVLLALNGHSNDFRTCIFPPQNATVVVVVVGWPREISFRGWMSNWLSLHSRRAILIVPFGNSIYQNITFGRVIREWTHKKRRQSQLSLTLLPIFSWLPIFLGPKCLVDSNSSFHWHSFI